MREFLKGTLLKLGLLPAAKRLLRALNRYRDLYHGYRTQRVHRDRYLQFKQRHGAVLHQRLNQADRAPKVALVSSVHFPEVELEFAVLKALEVAGFTPIVLIERDDWIVRKYYKLADVQRVHAWGDLVEAADGPAAEAVIDGCESVQELLRFEYGGARVGTFAASTAMRRFKVGSLDLQSAKDREMLLSQVASGMAQADAARKILDRYRPELAVFIDKAYSPKGELFDNCLARGVDCVSWDLSHRSSALVLKRFTYENRDTSTDSISDETWDLLRSMEFTDAHRERLERELHEGYASGDWYSVAGTQFNKRFLGPEEIRGRLGLDPSKKTAIVFPHVSWDATLFWGSGLYENYEDWLVDTVRAACANDRVNWVVKIHPAHIGKAVREGFEGEPAEVTALRRDVGELPPHVFVIPADSDISTFSLFDMMDWCITVRGRVGIEAAKCGIPVLTAGRGAYDGRGFTVDPASREEYVQRLAAIETIPRLSPEQKELAERFAYGFYLLRPLRLTSATLTYDESHEKAASRGQINLQRKEDWYDAPDIRALADWLKDRSREDFLTPADLPAAAGSGRAPRAAAPER